MDLFGDMKRFHVGTSDDGNPMFSLPLTADEDGLVGRECPGAECEPAYFKIAGSADGSMDGDDAEDVSQITVTCPYCGLAANFQQFHTRGQKDWFKSMAMRSIAGSLQRTLADAVKPLSRPRGGMLSISFRFKPGRLPLVREYTEEKLKRVVCCDKCQRQYAVYAVACYCPRCGEGNLLVHLRRSADILRALVEMAAKAEELGGVEARSQHLGNCLEDVVSLFEGFLKVIYRRALVARHGAAPETRLAQVKTSFQRLPGAEEFFRRDFQCDLLGCLDTREHRSLEMAFTKRHVITHNMGLVDAKYQRQARSYGHVGRTIEVDAPEVDTALQLVERVLEHGVRGLGLE